MGPCCSGRHCGHAAGLPTAKRTDHDGPEVSYDIASFRSLRLRESDCLAAVMFTTAGRHVRAVWKNEYCDSRKMGSIPDPRLSGNLWHRRSGQQDHGQAGERARRHLASNHVAG